MITGELKGKVDKLWTHFWNNGISNPISVIEQISYLLFMRRLDDEEINKENKARRIRKPVENPTFSPEQQDCRWSKFRELNPEEKLATVRDRAFPLIKNLGGEASESAYAKHMKEAVFLIASPALLSQAIEQIDNILDGIQEQARNSPDESYVDLMGDLYEYMLSKLSQAGTNGQFRTPRHIIKLMVELMEPTEREVVCDPACGTAGFLVGVAEYLNKRKQSELMAQENREHFKGGMFHGFDFDGTMLRIGSMNMMLHGIENPTIEARDSLSEDHASVEEAFTLVLANPPFKGSVAKDGIAKDLTQVVKTTKTELLFVALFLRLLKVGGRCAAIVPDGVLFGSSRAHKAIRKALVEEHKLDGRVDAVGGV